MLRAYAFVLAVIDLDRSAAYYRDVLGFRILWGNATDWRLAGGADLMRFSALSAEGLGKADLGMREWIGLFAYRLTGKTSAFFPGPDPY
jgi:catechol 2,3-dioxygenase-like lactoylglutathione lyase family enzyme